MFNMENKKPRKIKFSNSFRKSIDEILDRKDKDAFEAVAKGIKEISENPYVGREIITIFNGNVLRKLKNMGAREIESIAVEGNSFVYDMNEDSQNKIELEKNLEDFYLHFTDNSDMSLYGTSLWKDNHKVSKEIIRGWKGKLILFDFEKYSQPYCIFKLSCKEKFGDLLMKSYAAAI